MHKVVVHINSTLHHFSQLLAGLEFLNSKNEIRLKYKLDLGRYPENIFLVEVNGAKVFFDLADSSDIKPVVYEEADLYAKRMLLKSDFQRSEKLIPYGLYYPVYFRSPSLKYLFLKDLSFFKYSLKYWKSVAALLDLKDGISVNELEYMESDPAEGKQIIFRSRLWDEGLNHPQWKREKRKILNDERIQINRLLKEKFGQNFTGGFRRDEFSQKKCPDLSLPMKDFHRKIYLQNMRISTIGIATPGLESSVGAKVGEYVANGLAILTTPVDQYEIPGFEEGKNYLTYKNPEECVELASELVKNEDLRKKLQKINMEYYTRHLHPGKKVTGILDQVSNKISTCS
ncbi:Glycosyl transferases group 1 [Salinimicrobium catena]|uniref:Glycosyl transferases group 1 n=1 Tax=Salinimicrobium catena TaxID=390640 RepID=A0A1H5NAK4_9FLAO|nr:glycosyltransferase [Salinimicrobium catena]SDL40956.1 Glycosyl transferases group 1 [Salinimicrobium catena]SEE98480.1 Glycosyl transferases group 1 [Salinimicrobium catena]